MKKAAPSSDPKLTCRKLLLPIIERVGVRLLLLLLVAEIPLVVFTVAIALQNDRLRASDALSRAAHVQQDALQRVRRDIQVAAALAIASGALPASLQADPRPCDAVLGTLIAANADRIASAAILARDGVPRCSSDRAQPGPAVQVGAALLTAPPGRLKLLATPSGVYVVHAMTFNPGPTGNPPGAVAIRLASERPDPQPEPGIPLPSMWLRQAGQWLPIDAASRADLPKDAAALEEGPARALRAPSSDGRAFLYSVTSLAPGFADPGTILLAASDIRGAATAARDNLLLRLLEMAGFFLCEFLLIAAGISQVVTQPLRKLSRSVGSWRHCGTFSHAGLATDSRELRDLATSFTQATQSLNQREAELRGAIAQQDLLMREIHHRVKNNLQIVASLLNLQSSRIKVPEARAEFQSARDRVRALATLHRHLYADGTLHMIDMRAFFAELCSQLFQALGEPEGDRVCLRVAAPDIDISSDQAVPIALIVTETVGNAIKYAFPGNRRGTITVMLDVADDDRGVLSVADDGVGMTDAPQPPERHGLGLQLVRGFARQLGATLTVTHAGGTCYHVAMKLERNNRQTGLPVAPSLRAVDA